MTSASARLVLAFVVSGIAAEAHAETLVVSPAGPWRSLAAAVREAPAGATVTVRAGTYREPPVLVDRPLTIVGEGQPVIEPAEAATVIRVTANDVTIRGLVLANVPPSRVDDRAAIRFDRVQRCRVEQVEIRNAPYGVYVSESSQCRISGNTVRGSGDSRTALGNAIHLWSSRQMVLTDNTVTGHRDGIYFEFVQDASIERNVSRDNARYGLHFMFSDGCSYRDNTLARNGAGVAVMYTRNVVMTGNLFADNRGPTSYGLLLKDISTSRLTGNHFTGNTVALHIEGGGGITVSGNRFTRNGWAVRLMANSSANLFEGNAFDANSFDLSTNSRATTATVTGNWWDRYRGFDLDRNGRGDLPFHPVRLFSLLVGSQPPSIIMMRSAFVDVLDAAERALPVLTPATLVDTSPLMARPQ